MDFEFKKKTFLFYQALATKEMPICQFLTATTNEDKINTQLQNNLHFFANDIPIDYYQLFVNKEILCKPVTSANRSTPSKSACSIAMTPASANSCSG